MFVNRHQVVGFPSRLREPALKELVERLQLLQPPVLAGAHFAEILAQFHKPGIALVLMPGLPGQDRVDPAQDLLGTTTIQLGRHGRILSTQVRQTDQDRLPACGSARPQPDRAGRDRAGSPPVAVIPLGSDPGFSTATPISESLQWRSHLLYIPICRNNYGDIMCAVKVQTLTPTEAAVVACVPVRDVNRIIDEKILPEAFYVADRYRARRFYADACAFISFYFRAANRLTSEERMRTIAVASARLREESGSVLEKEWIIREEFLTIDLAPFLRNVHRS